MDRRWVPHFYDRRSLLYGPSGIQEHHIRRAETIARIAPGKPLRVLELGCGAGGAAAATASAGHDVTAVEVSPVRAGFARDLAREVTSGSMTVVETDFYEFVDDRGFDVVVYWDGFGVGSDEDQRALLRRIAEVWLRPGGCALVDVSNPAPWIAAATEPEQVRDGGIRVRRTFQLDGCRFIDTTTYPDDEELSQSIRCYFPADFAALVAGTGLAIDRLEAEGRPFRVPGSFDEGALSAEDWLYLAKLRLA